MARLLTFLGRCDLIFTFGYKGWVSPCWINTSIKSRHKCETRSKRRAAEDMNSQRGELETWLTGHLSEAVSTTRQLTDLGQFGRGSVEEPRGVVSPAPTGHSGRDSQWGSNMWHHSHKVNSLLMLWSTVDASHRKKTLCCTGFLYWLYYQQNKVFT